MCNRGRISLSVNGIFTVDEFLDGYYLRCESDLPNEAKIFVGARKISLIASSIPGTEFLVWVLPLQAQKLKS